MITLFRKIRQKLLQQNRITRYLAYAVGEIALVMVGILLALQVNTWNENRKNQQFIGVILKEIQQDLLNDLVEFGLAVKWAEEMDTLSLKTIRGELMDEDFENPELQALWSLGTIDYPLELSDRSYQQLIQQKEKIQEENRGILSMLNSLYVEDHSFLDQAQEDLRQTTYAYATYLHETKPWIVDLALKKPNEQAIKYFLQDPIHKQKIAFYHRNLEVYHAYASRVKDKSALNYMVIRYLLGDTTELPSQIKEIFPFNTQPSLNYEANFRSIGDDGETFDYKIDQQYNLILWENLSQQGFYYKSMILMELSPDSLQFSSDKRTTIKILRDQSGKITGFQGYKSGVPDIKFKAY